MATRRHDRLTTVLKEIEALAKRLRAELRRAAREGLTKNLERAAAALRKQAVLVAAQVEKYVHELRIELAKGAPAKRPAPKRRAVRAA
jgi:F0F1-type ATP synthase membrane subunit b/b'